MKVRMYGRLADAIGREVMLDLTPSTARDLIERLAAAHPEASAVLRQSRAVADGKMMATDERISESRIIELLPPVCGG